MIDKETFDAWRAHSSTKQVFQFLRDYRAMMAEQWASGTKMTDDQQALAMAYGELVDLEHEEIAKFYGVENERDDESAGETSGSRA